MAVVEEAREEASQLDEGHVERGDLRPSPTAAATAGCNKTGQMLKLFRPGTLEQRPLTFS